MFTAENCKTPHSSLDGFRFYTDFSKLLCTTIAEIFSLFFDVRIPVLVSVFDMSYSFVSIGIGIISYYLLAHNRHPNQVNSLDTPSQYICAHIYSNSSVFVMVFRMVLSWVFVLFHPVFLLNICSACSWTSLICAGIWLFSHRLMKDLTSCGDITLFYDLITALQKV